MYQVRLIVGTFLKRFFNAKSLAKLCNPQCTARQNEFQSKISLHMKKTIGTFKVNKYPCYFFHSFSCFPDGESNHGLLEPYSLVCRIWAFLNGNSI